MRWLQEEIWEGRDWILGALRKIAKSDYYLYVCLSALNNSAPTRRIFMKFDI